MCFKESNGELDNIAVQLLYYNILYHLSYCSLFSNLLQQDHCWIWVLKQIRTQLTTFLQIKILPECQINGESPKSNGNDYIYIN